MSRLPFELLLALRYLRPKRSFVSIITLISITGVALGVAVLIIVISVMSGFDHDLRDKVLGFNAHLKVFARDQTLADYPRVMSLVAANKEVRGVAPFVVGPVLLETEPTNSQPLFAVPYVRGVDTNYERSVSVLPTSLAAGTFDVGGRSLIVGIQLAQSLDLSVGDRVSISSPRDIERMKKAHERKEDETILPDDYTITGIFSVGYFDYDANVVVTSLENAQEFYDLGQSVHGLMVMLDNPYQADAVRGELQRSLGANYRITTWEEENATILSALAVEKNLMFYIMFFIVIVAAFGITCTLITFVMMKTSEIGLMKAVGASNRQVMLVFVTQSLIISLFGIAAGLGLGLFALHIRNEFLEFMRWLTGLALFPASIYEFGQLPALIIPGDIAVICGGSLVICLLAAILPARHASKMKTVEALRYE